MTTEPKESRTQREAPTPDGPGISREVLQEQEQRALSDSTSDSAQAVGDAGVAEVPALTLWSDVWMRLRKNKLAILGLGIILTLVLTALMAPWIAPYDHTKINLSISLSPPTANHWFGTDILGRDYFSRVVYGSRISISIGIVTLFIAMSIGIPLGAVAGYFGTWLDAVIMRIADILFAFPFIVWVIVFITVLEQSVNRMLLLYMAIGLFSWAGVARIFRSSVMQVKNMEYVEAARALGASHTRVLIRHVIPNSLAPVIVFGTILTGTVILTEAALSFLGVGVPVQVPAWGKLIAEGKPHLTTEPWLILFPGISTVVTVLGFIFLGDGLRDSMDPRLR